MGSAHPTGVNAVVLLVLSFSRIDKIYQIFLLPIIQMTSPFSPQHRFFSDRLAWLMSIVVIVPLGLMIKFYRGPGQEWLNNSFGGVPYEIFWILLVLLIWPQVSAVWASVGVCIATCLLEVLQLWQPPFLQAIRATLIGRLVLGNTFQWSDFPYYFMGSFLGWLWVWSIQHQILRSKIDRAENADDPIE